MEPEDGAHHSSTLSSPRGRSLPHCQRSSRQPRSEILTLARETSHGNARCWKGPFCKLAGFSEGIKAETGGHYSLSIILLNASSENSGSLSLPPTRRSATWVSVKPRSLPQPSDWRPACAMDDATNSLPVRVSRGSGPWHWWEQRGATFFRAAPFLRLPELPPAYQRITWPGVAPVYLASS